MTAPYVPNNSPWIQLNSTVVVNLDFIIKALRKSDAAEGIIFFHAGAAATGTNVIASQRVNYSNATVADDKFSELLTLIQGRKSLVDLSE